MYWMGSLRNTCQTSVLEHFVPFLQTEVANVEQMLVAMPSAGCFSAEAKGEDFKKCLQLKKELTVNET